jgi:Spy/CpxP family protein refolding chaperone
VRQRYKDELRDRQEIARQAREALRSLRTRNASPEEIQSQVRDLRRAQNAVRQIRNKQKLAMRDILTPEQWRQFNQATRSRKWAKGTTRRQKLNDDIPERQPGLSDPIRYPDPTLY